MSYIEFKKVLNFKSNQKYYSNKRDDAQNDIDNFDFITCDNILIVYDLINQYSTSRNIELKTFFYYEILYFHSNSIKYVDKVLKNDMYCINVNVLTDAVELFRIINVIKMLDEAQIFLDSEKTSINIDNGFKEHLNNKLDTYISDIENMANTSKELIKNL